MKHRQKPTKNLSAVALAAQKREVENLLALAQSGRTFTAAQREALAAIAGDGTKPDVEAHGPPDPAADPSDAERVRFSKILHRLFADGIIMLCPDAKD